MFDASRLHVQPLSRRVSDLDSSVVLPLDAPLPPFDHFALSVIAKELLEARDYGYARILFIGAHVIRRGVQRFIIDLMEEGLIDHIAMNGGAAIHDCELARYGHTTESVSHYLQSGEFGLWDEVGKINECIARVGNTGAGERLGRFLSQTDSPYADLSILGNAVVLGIPATVHVGIGCDIVCEHPNYNAAAWGQRSYDDFLTLAASMERLGNGVLINAGSAVFGPEVCLKALSMARNVAHQDGKKIENFTTAVFDLQLVDNGNACHPDDPQYYNRAWKSLCCRAPGVGGQSFYIQGDHVATIPALWHACKDESNG